MKIYKHLTLGERYQIYACKKSGWSNRAIAAELGVDQTTIGRELKRNQSGRGYRPQHADKLAALRRQGKAKKRISVATWEAIEADLECDFSPEQIHGRRSLEGKETVSHEWIYRHIYQDKTQGGNLYQHLRSQKKRKKRYGKNSKRGALVNQISIEKRPPVVTEKSRIGDWEVDSVIGKAHQGAIVTMVERKTKLLRMEKLDYKTAVLTKEAICKLLIGLEVKTITSDNGKEFALHQEIAKLLEADFYFCHPYSSWERGVNENTNGLVRQYFPKQMKFATITEQDIKLAEDKLNNRPRKTLGYQTPNEVYNKELKELHKVALTT
jgi:transposase, IS30 family